MIARGSMVALKGHHRVPMVVIAVREMVTIKVRWSESAAERALAAIERNRAIREFPHVKMPWQALPAFDDPQPYDEEVEVVWLDANAVPQRAIFPISIMEEIDG